MHFARSTLCDLESKSTSNTMRHYNKKDLTEIRQQIDKMHCTREDQYTIEEVVKRLHILIAKRKERKRARLAKAQKIQEEKRKRVRLHTSKLADGQELLEYLGDVSTFSSVGQNVG